MSMFLKLTTFPHGGRQIRHKPKTEGVSAFDFRCRLDTLTPSVACGDRGPRAHRCAAGPLARRCSLREGVEQMLYRPIFSPACQPVLVAFMMFLTPVQSPAKAKLGAAAERAAASSKLGFRPVA